MIGTTLSHYRMRDLLKKVQGARGKEVFGKSSTYFSIDLPASL